MRVLLTGAAGHLGRVLLPRLLAAPGITGVTGLDLRAVSLCHPRLRVIAGDLLGPALPQALEGADAVIHLAFVVLPSSLGRRWREPALARRINRAGATRLALASAQAGVARLIVASSVAVYGAGPDLPALIPESWPRRPLPGFAYAEDKAAVETWLEGFAPTTATLAITRLRLAAIVGPQAQPLVNAIARSRILPRAPQARLQCLHEEDAAAAFLAALAGPPGIYNIAAPGALPWHDFAHGDGRLRLALPLPWLDRAQRALARLTPRVGDAGWLRGAGHPPVADPAHAEALLGWRAERSVSQCLALLRGHRRPPAGEAAG